MIFPIYEFQPATGFLLDEIVCLGVPAIHVLRELPDHHELF
jgi:hypothetical protein